MTKAKTKVATRLIHGRVWPAIVKKAKGQSHIDAAISYITVAPNFLKKGDRIACDFTISRIRQGSTDPKAVVRLIERGVEVYNQPNLHAKIIVGAGVVFVGSANASRKSGLWVQKPKRAVATLNEAEIITSDASVLSQAKKFVLGLFQPSRLISPDDAKALEKFFRIDAPKGSNSTSPKTTTTRVWRARYDSYQEWSSDQMQAIKNSEIHTQEVIKSEFGGRYLEWNRGTINGFTKKQSGRMRRGDKIVAIVGGSKTLNICPYEDLVNAIDDPMDPGYKLWRTIRRPGPKERKWKVSVLKKAGAPAALYKGWTTRLLSQGEIEKLDKLWMKMS